MSKLSNFEVICPRSVIFSFPDNKLCKCQGNLTKLGTCIDIKEIWFGNANGQIASMFDRVICRDTIMAGYYSLTFLLYDALGSYELPHPLSRLCYSRSVTYVVKPKCF